MKRKQIEIIIDKMTVISGGISAFGGFILMAGATDNDSLGIGTFASNTKLIIIGLLLFAAGMYFSGAFQYKYEYDCDELEEEQEDVVGKLAWSSEELSYITVVDYVDEHHWSYILCNPSGFLTSKEIVNTDEDFNNYEWVIA